METKDECKMCGHGKIVKDGWCADCLKQYDAVNAPEKKCASCGEPTDDCDLLTSVDGNVYCRQCVEDGGGYHDFGIEMDYEPDMER